MIHIASLPYQFAVLRDSRAASGLLDPFAKNSIASTGGVMCTTVGWHSVEFVAGGGKEAVQARGLRTATAMVARPKAEAHRRHFI
jgi:hypothetical protein